MANGGGGNYSWDLGNGKSATGTEVKATYDSTADYKVTVTRSLNGKNASASSTVPVREQIIEIKTSFGNMYMWLYNATPLHKKNFLKLTTENFFDGTTFHRIVPNFVIQGGDPNSKDTDPNNDGQGGPGYLVPAEIKSDLKHIFGAVGAARNNNPQKSSNGSQYYIVTNPSGTSSLNGQYTVFGQIVKGTDIAVTIQNQPRGAGDRPVTDIKMDVNILEKTRAEIRSEYGFTNFR